MSVMTIGRTPVDCPYRPVEIGRTYTFAFDVGDPTASVAEVLARCEQLKGLTVGQVLPIINADDTRLSGFYRLVAYVFLEPTEVYLVNGYVRGEITLTRLQGASATPLTQVEILQEERNNASPSYRGRVWFPAAATAPSSDATPVEKATEDGNVAAFAYDDEELMSAIVPPEDFMTGRARIEFWQNGVWRELVGRSLPAGVGVSDVRISNGRFRWWWELDGSDWSLWVSRFSGGAYSDPEVAVESISDGTDDFTPFVPAVMRNTPMTVALEYRSSGAGAAVGSVYLTLDRGDPYVGVSFGKQQATTWTMAETVDQVGEHLFVTTPAEIVLSNTLSVTSGAGGASITANGVSSVWMVGAFDSGSPDETASLVYNDWAAGLTFDQYVVPQ